MRVKNKSLIKLIWQSNYSTLFVTQVSLKSVTSSIRRLREADAFLIMCVLNMGVCSNLVLRVNEIG